MDLDVCSTPTPIQPPPTVQTPQPPLPPLISSCSLSASTLPSPYQLTLPPSSAASSTPPPPPPPTTRHDDLLESVLQQPQQHTDDKDDHSQSIPFKVWRSQLMTTSNNDDHDNIPIDPPLLSTQREKHLRKTQRDIQLRHYRSWCIKEFRQRRQVRCGKQQHDTDSDDDNTSTKRQRTGDNRHVRFIVPPKLKRGRSSIN